MVGDKMGKLRRGAVIQWAIMAIVALISTESCQAEDMTNTLASNLYGLIDMFVATPPIDHSVVERAAGVHLLLASSGVFDDYIARDVKVGGTTIDLIDYREPSGGGGPKRGPMLALKLGGRCVEREALLLHYEGLAISDVPRGRSPNEQTYYARQEPWGTLSFGFAEHSPDCLRTIVFSVRAPAEARSLLR
jgi:hypothetical protein